MVISRLQMVFAAALALPAALPAAPYLVKDLHPGPSEEFQPVGPGGLGMGPEVSYFSGSDPAHGTELWRSDGTPAGTWRLTDVCAGRCSSDPFVVRLFHGQVFFSADDGFAGRELWVTDGTPGGEHRVRDLCPGPCSSSPSYFDEVAGSLLFFASNGPRLQLWKTDGTRDGTVRVKLICTSSCDPFPGLFPAGERAFFFKRELGTAELWVTDGTSAGTRPFRDVLGSDLTPLGIYLSVIPGPGFAWVWTQDGLWRSDGTAAGTSRLKAISELALDATAFNDPFRALVWNGLFFGVLGQGEMIRSDGTPEGTSRIFKFATGYAVNDLVALRDEILFTVYDPADPTSIWRSQGTAETTVPVLHPGESGFVATLVSLGGRALFRFVLAGDTYTSQIWVTDGTASGTRKLDVPDGFHDPDGLVPAGARAFFLRHDTYAADDLWITDGSEAGTQRVRDFRIAPGSSGPLAQQAAGNRLLFSGQTGLATAPLFSTDGTAAGTHVVSNDASWASGFARLGDRFLFKAAERSESSPGFPPYLSSKGLWRTDGTPAGTAQVAVSPVAFLDPVALGGSLLFADVIGVAPFGRTDVELWKSDGTAAGTALVKDIDPYLVDTGFHHACVGEASNPRPALVLAGRLLLSADDGTHGRELWVTDGTRRGTQLFLDLNPRRSSQQPPGCEDTGSQRPDTGLSSNPEGFVKLGRAALFTADDGATGRELWRTDGTPQGTRRVADLRPGPQGSAPHDLVALQGRIYFFAWSAGGGEALWRSDGTAHGTVRVRNLGLDGLPSWGRSLTAAGDRLFFTVYNESTGAELWTSCGDSASTTLVADLNPGPASSSPQSLTNVGGVLLFAADDGLTGLEPWRSDGTAAGTVRLADLSPGPAASSPGPFTRIGNLVLTGADDGIHGREPWAIPVADILQH